MPANINNLKPLPMQSFHQVVKDDFDAVNARILRELHSDVPLVESIGQHLIDAGGKRLRPLLVLLAARAFGYRGDHHISVAAIIEFIHTATLLHDDVVDTSELRRGRLTANARWGNAPSVLVGDFLYSRAFQMMVAIGDIDVMTILADTTNIISEGEVQQLINARNDDITEQDYLTVIDKKTARLFEAAARCGAVIADATSGQVEALGRYGHHLGMAFQLVDDALDYSSDSTSLGKNVGDDLAEGKPTLPLIHILDKGSEEQAALVRRAIREGGRELLDPVMAAIVETDSLTYTLSQARIHTQHAIDCLGHIAPSAIRTALKQLALFATERSS